MTAPTRRRHLFTGIVGAATLVASLALAPAALAGKPITGPSANNPIEFAAGELCENAIRFENTTLRSRDTLFDPARDGSQRLVTRGSGVSVVTDLETGALYHMRGGFRFAVTSGADGSVRVDGSGTDIIAWYFPGDDSVLGPGLWDVEGRLHEWYAADGSFIKATFKGHATDICAALGG